MRWIRRRCGQSRLTFHRDRSLEGLVGEAIGAVEGGGAAGVALEQLAEVRPEPRVVAKRGVRVLELAERRHERLGDVAPAELALDAPSAVVVGLEQPRVDRGRTDGEVGPVDAGRPGPFHEQRHHERVLARALVPLPRSLDPGGDVDADRRSRPNRVADGRRVEAAGKDDRDLARNRGGERRRGAGPGAARVGTSGRVEQQAFGAGREELATLRDDRRGGCGHVRRLVARQVDDLPGLAPDGGDRRGLLATGQLDGIRVEARDDLADPLLARIGGDGDDLRQAGGGRQCPGDAPQLDGFIEGQRPRRARHEIEPDRVGAGTDCGEDAIGVGHAADLHERCRGHVGGIARRATGRDERPDGGGRVGGADEGLADERGVEPDGSPRGDGRGVANTGLADDEPVLRDERAEADRPLGVDVEGPQVAVVQADEPRSRRERTLELLLVVGLDERLEPDLDGARDKPGEPLRRMEDGEQEHEIRAGRPEVGQLDRFDDELLGQDRDRDGRPNGPQVVDRAAEPVRLAQHGDGDRASGLVGPSPGHDVLVAIGDVAGRRRAPLDLGDDVKAGCGEPIENRPRRAGSGRDREVVVEGQAGHLVADVGPAAFGDLGDNVGLAPRRRCGAPPIRRPGPAARGSSCRRPFGLGLVFGPQRLDVAAFGAQSLEQLRPEPGIDRQAGSVDPRFERVDRARDEQRRPGVEEHDVAPRAGLAAEHRLGDPGVLGGRPTGQLGRRCPPEAERGGVDLPPLDAVRRHVIEDARSVERQLVDPIAVDDERPLGPEELGNVGDPGGRRRVAHAEELACRPGRVRQRTEQVERRSDPDLAARRTGVLHRRVEPRREHEREPALAEGLARRQRVVVDPDAERVEDVGRPRSRGDRAVAVLRDGDPSGGDDERGRSSRC